MAHVKKHETISKITKLTATENIKLKFLALESLCGAPKFSNILTFTHHRFLGEVILCCSV